jgi:hypothetical protein
LASGPCANGDPGPTDYDFAQTLKSAEDLIRFQTNTLGRR